ncbi:MAG: hypothetical protein RL297_1699 [Pseudomonadota bacterium]
MPVGLQHIGNYLKEAQLLNVAHRAVSEFYGRHFLAVQRNDHRRAQGKMLKACSRVVCCAIDF